VTESRFVARDLSSREAFDKVLQGKYTWQSPSNIALVKYWGKTEPQIPTNPSISFTLSNCHTRTTIHYKRKVHDNENLDFKVIFEGRPKPDFHPKIEQFLRRILPYQPFLAAFEFEIHTENSFPHSSGIASSASGMSALALCLMSLEKELDPTISDEYFHEKASFLARLGSGSASRSIEGPLVVWGEHKEIKSSSDLYGVTYPYEVDEAFKDYQDTILLVDKGVKQVSSTVGHGLMKGHPFSEARFRQAENHLSELIPVLKSGNLDAFIEIVEKEALSLHAMMLTSSPYFILMRPNTLEIIERIWAYRRATGSKLCFTLDAGANVHLLYPKSEKENVDAFIEKDLAHFCQNNHYISDHTGNGAKEIM
jgi:diphosphomevalonate decarboxylase